MFLKLHGFNEFPAMIGTDNKITRIITRSHTPVIAKLGRGKQTAWYEKMQH
jgi:hypothetical protein